jgi:hypothetical protein
MSETYLPIVTGVAVIGDHLLRLLFSGGHPCPARPPVGFQKSATRSDLSFRRLARIR